MYDSSLEFCFRLCLYTALLLQRSYFEQFAAGFLTVQCKAPQPEN